MEKVCVLGTGSWGSALALGLAKKGNDVSMWTRKEEQAKKINRTKENTDYLPGVLFPNNITISTDIEKTIKDCKVIILAVPSQAVRSTCQKIKPFIKEGQVIVNVAKGLEKGTGLRLSQVCEEELPQNPYVILSGPSHAEEVARDIPTTVVVASKDLKIAQMIQDLFMSPKLRVYTNPDIVGVELGGALKNIIAFGAGICDGLGYGDNAKAALMTRGISEMSRLGIAMGANMSTFAGLSGIGDLIVTCTSMHSRNRRAGILIGKGMSLEDTLKEVKMVVEGITATEVAHDVAEKLDIDMPITNAIYSVIKKGSNPKEVGIELMMRSKKHEMEEVVLGDDI
ncbi:TPA: NAD(P)H-dependent glycerol-3-phosphate dehydrogenase [Clostridioides difficile]|uniref:NAD(P)H-dependent glycerol-3-phosphate dehydrogenase n=1 Tax=Clostridioides difficile TaxID=1496 RepID=UPI00017F5167|nr:NAD(P)H-dependent glycerol-3-phosphate dehydrogenase [Clostridioides difficile]MBJ9768387.1 NAD(P)H-dependent glycerol-3-phosphate dehydrogenase [Clostridioides difficile]MCE0686896.1 NAD(P)H-dependent glycerol-3-phosphate dehydrogenase [Clostridioides difficile]MCE0711340.1 NAD(P)H-dependent glycerol-3-phosphate dehydrogenase [Clostridioides difficile]MCE0718486.1 NAD(P)H-dependent glycerol-3-phosphate dehydrogenase [Clostridioides difficile]MCE0728139.1 NAD(P)H-dependent glycerol-3-phosph